METEHSAELPNERREDHGRSARKGLKLRPDYILGGLIVSGLAGGQVKTVLSSSDLSAEVRAQGAEQKARTEAVVKKLEESDAKLSSLQLALTEMRARGDAGDERVKSLMTEFVGFRLELRDLRDGAVRSATKQEEVERRVAALEGKK